MSVELKGCPFCGASASGYAIEAHTHALVDNGFRMPDHTGSYVIEGDCACGSGMIGENEAEVTARWNTRAPVAAQEEAKPVAWKDMAPWMRDFLGKGEGYVRTLYNEPQDAISHTDVGSWIQVASDMLRRLHPPREAGAAAPDEGEAARTDRKRLAILATFAQEVCMGAILPSERAAAAKEALRLTGLQSLDDIVALSAPKGEVAAPASPSKEGS